MNIALFELDNSHDFDSEIEKWWDVKPRPLSALAKKWFRGLKGVPIKRRYTTAFQPHVLIHSHSLYVDCFKAHVNIGFYYGAFLTDPKKILIGTGKRMRHIKLTVNSKIEEELLENLIEESYEDLKKQTTQTITCKQITTTILLLYSAFLLLLMRIFFCQARH